MKIKIEEKAANLFWGGATEATLSEKTDKKYAEKKYAISGALFDGENVIAENDLQHAIKRGWVKVQ